MNIHKNNYLLIILKINIFSYIYICICCDEWKRNCRRNALWLTWKGRVCSFVLGGRFLQNGSFHFLFQVDHYWLTLREFPFALRFRKYQLSNCFTSVYSIFFHSFMISVLANVSSYTGFCFLLFLVFILLKKIPSSFCISNFLIFLSYFFPHSFRLSILIPTFVSFPSVAEFTLVDLLLFILFFSSFLHFSNMLHLFLSFFLYIFLSFFCNFFT